MRIPLGYLVCVLASASLLGCNDLGQVRDFAAISSQPEVYQKLVGEYVHSSDRKKQYVAVNQYARIDTQTADRQKQVAGLTALQKVLTGYMKMLASVADDKVAEVGESTSSIKTELKTLGGGLKLEAAQVTAIGKLIDFGARAAIDGYRQKELSKLLKDNDPSVQVLLKQMRFISGGAIKQALEDEKAALDKRYTGILTPLDANSLSYLQASQTWFEKRNEISEKVKACDSYAAALEKIAAGHKKLALEADRMSKKDLSNLISGYKEETKALYDAAKDLL